MVLKARMIDHINMKVKNLDESVKFYKNLFGFVIKQEENQNKIDAPSKIIGNDYSPVFSIDNLHKDVALGIAMGLKSGMKLEISESGQKLNNLARTAGFGKEDTSAIFKILVREEIT